MTSRALKCRSMCSGFTDFPTKFTRELVRYASSLQYGSSADGEYDGG